MRLINTETLELQVFSDDRAAPPYAILSHRWVENQEVKYQDMLTQNQTEQNETINLKGWRKIKRCCRKAARENLSWLWVDTCCIDQNSSAELSEAINSMYRWYANARVCFTYLADVSRADPEWQEAFVGSEWFCRSWTLQELLAPLQIKFFDRDWHLLGRKLKVSMAPGARASAGLSELWSIEDDLSELIERATRIPRSVLSGRTHIMSCSVAQRMSWASGRKATRVEDIAYSLLGLFDVNMAMIYGEGEKAFIRLQEEIIRATDDHSIFAWTRQGHHDRNSVTHSPVQDMQAFFSSISAMSEQASTSRPILARSPVLFQNCSQIAKYSTRRQREPYSMTNIGLSISLPLKPWCMNTYLALLDCAGQDGSGNQIGIFLRQLPGTDTYGRVEVEGQDLYKVFGTPQPQRLRRIHIHSPRTTYGVEVDALAQQFGQSEGITYGFKIQSRSIFRTATVSANNNKYNTVSANDIFTRDLFTVYSLTNEWSLDRRILSIPTGNSGTAGIIDISRQELFVAAIKLGFDFDFNPVCIIASYEARDTLANKDWTTWTYLQEGSDDLIGKTIFQVNCMEISGWCEIRQDCAVKNPALLKGMWALKGDAVRGLSFRIPELRLKVEIKKVLDDNGGASGGNRYTWVFDSEGLMAKYIEPELSAPLMKATTL